MTNSGTANYHLAYEEGLKITKEIAGTEFLNIELSRTQLVKTMGWKYSTIKINDKKVQIDPKQLFHKASVF